MVSWREIGRRRRSSSGPGAAMSVTNGKQDGDHCGSPPASTSPSPHRVSFSSDLSQPQHQSEYMTSKEQRSGDLFSAPTSTKDEPPHTTGPSLTVHDRAAAIMSGSPVTGPPIIGSPATTTTTTPTDEKSSRHSMPPASPPTSSRNRNRGLSLRSSLFTQSIERQVRSPELGIERHSFPSLASNKTRAAGGQEHGKRKSTW